MNLAYYPPALSELGIGFDFNFEKFSVFGLGWHAYRSFVFGLRLDARLSDGDTPFYSQPFVKLRGIPAMRHQDQ